MPSLQPLQRAIQPVPHMMGDWFVQRGIPAVNFLEHAAHNAKENYKYNEKRNRVEVTYTFNDKTFDGKLVTTYQRAYFKNHNNTYWGCKPYLGLFYFPVALSYYVLDVAPDYSWVVCSAPNKSWMYIMTRKQECTEEELAPRLELVRSLGFDMKKVKTFPQRCNGPAAS